ncbi:MAG: Dabb family protein [Nitrospirae bacterium]|nr:Dabb family protein [Nitrospirota bacterium]
MITHLVLFKLSDPSPAAIQKTKEVLVNMDGKIPELRSVTVGIDVIRSPRSYDLALITKFDSVQALQAYQNHPVHQEVLRYIASVKESSISVDFEET